MSDANEGGPHSYARNTAYFEQIEIARYDNKYKTMQVQLSRPMVAGKPTFAIWRALNEFYSNRIYGKAVPDRSPVAIVQL